MELTTLTLGPAQLLALIAIVRFHLDNDDFDGEADPPYDLDALKEIAAKLGFLDKDAITERKGQR